MTEEEVDAQDKVRTRFARLISSDDMGLPPAAALIPPANELGARKSE